MHTFLGGECAVVGLQSTEIKCAPTWILPDREYSGRSVQLSSERVGSLSAAVLTINHALNRSLNTQSRPGLVGSKP
jgi:hypothetical protein